MMPEIICPHCKNSITDDDALLCHFCGESLRRASNGALGKIRYGEWQMWLIIAITLIVGFFLMRVF